MQDKLEATERDKLTCIHCKMKVIPILCASRGPTMWMICPACEKPWVELDGVLDGDTVKQDSPDLASSGDIPA